MPNSKTLVSRLRDPNFEGAFQHLRSSDDLDALHKEAADRIDELEKALRWCRPRLSKDAYRTRLDKMVHLAPAPAPDLDEPRLVHSEAQ
jgi:hypothetical protein